MTVKEHEPPAAISYARLLQSIGFAVSNSGTRSAFLTTTHERARNWFRRAAELLPPELVKYYSASKLEITFFNQSTISFTTDDNLRGQRFDSIKLDAPVNSVAVQMQGMLGAVIL